MKVIVIGASLNPLRISYRVTKLLQDQGHEVIAVGKANGFIGDVPVQSGIENISNIDTVTLYINPSIQPQYYDHIIDWAPRRVIFNPGTENEEFEEMLLKLGIEVEQACNLVLLKTGQF